MADTYKVVILPGAQKDLKGLRKADLDRIKKAVDELGADPRGQDTKKLKPAKDNIYRKRAGDYRIIYTIDDSKKTVTIERISSRGDAY